MTTTAIRAAEASEEHRDERVRVLIADHDGLGRRMMQNMFRAAAFNRRYGHVLEPKRDSLVRELNFEQVSHRGWSRGKAGGDVRQLVAVSGCS